MLIRRVNYRITSIYISKNTLGVYCLPRARELRRKQSQLSHKRLRRLLFHAAATFQVASGLHLDSSNDRSIA